MAAQQAKLHRLGRFGQDVVRAKTGGKQQTHKCPFDIVDTGAGVAYEVKTMSGTAKEQRIHIADASWQRKQAFLAEYGLVGVLMAVVVYTSTWVEVYQGPLTQHARIGQLQKISG